MAETTEEPVEPNKLKTCVLKASIHCEGCKRKVKKILSQVQGVDSVDVDTKQQKVTVTGSADADTLIKKLVKSGKHAQLWPQKPENKENINGKNKDKEAEKQGKRDHQEPNPSSDNAAKDPKPSPKVEIAANKDCEGSGGPAKAPDGGATQSNEESGGGSNGAPAAKAVSDASEKTSGGVQETKSEEKKSQEGCSASGEPPQAAVEKINGGGGEGGSTSGKKKKKKAQSGNLPASAPSSAAGPAFRGSENQESGSPPSANHSVPRNHHYPPPSHYYTPPPQPQPVYAVSYNAAYPTSSYTASYYTSPPPYSHAYMHPGLETQPPPSDPDLHPRQPLDSFEVFSDENPNGCSIM